MLDEGEGGFERTSWSIATTVMILASLITFIIQRLIHQIFDYVFEICIFYVPTLVVIIVYLTQKPRRTRIQEPD